MKIKATKSLCAFIFIGLPLIGLNLSAQACGSQLRSHFYIQVPARGLPHPPVAQLSNITGTGLHNALTHRKKFAMNGEMYYEWRMTYCSHFEKLSHHYATFSINHQVVLNRFDIFETIRSRTAPSSFIISSTANPPYTCIITHDNNGNLNRLIRCSKNPAN